MTLADIVAKHLAVELLSINVLPKRQIGGTGVGGNADCEVPGQILAIIHSADFYLGF